MQRKIQAYFYFHNLLEENVTVTIDDATLGKPLSGRFVTIISTKGLSREEAIWAAQRAMRDFNIEVVS